VLLDIAGATESGFVVLSRALAQLPDEPDADIALRALQSMKTLMLIDIQEDFDTVSTLNMFRPFDCRRCAGCGSTGRIRPTGRVTQVRAVSSFPRYLHLPTSRGGLPGNYPDASRPPNKKLKLSPTRRPASRSSGWPPPTASDAPPSIGSSPSLRGRQVAATTHEEPPAHHEVSMISSFSRWRRSGCSCATGRRSKPQHFECRCSEPPGMSEHSSRYEMESWRVPTAVPIPVSTARRTTPHNDENHG
jgi:hypothetical protein